MHFPSAVAGSNGGGDATSLAQLLANNMSVQHPAAGLNTMGGAQKNGGQWIQITMDSGAAENVIPDNLLDHVPTVEADRSCQAKRNGGCATDDPGGLPEGITFSGNGSAKATGQCFPGVPVWPPSGV